MSKVIPGETPHGFADSDRITGEMPVLAAEVRAAAAGRELLQVRQERGILPSPHTHSDSEVTAPVGESVVTN